MNDNTLTYEVPQKTAPPASVEYHLEKAVTGKVEKKVAVVLEDKEGNKLRAPWAPKKNCKRCFGRGFVGKDAITGDLVACRKCYPWEK